MELSRRSLLLGAGAVGVGTALAGSQVFAKSTKPMKILILGGTGFIGPHMVERALERGHDVTIFNRGRSNTHLFPEVKRLVGDRDGGLDSLKKGEWWKNTKDARSFGFLLAVSSRSLTHISCSRRWFL